MALNIYFIISELLIFSLFGISLRHALKTSLSNIFMLMTGVIFGILLELATIHQLHAYSYGKFLLMVGNVPLGIGMAWGVILYSVYHTSDNSNLPIFVRPFLDGLLVLNIDLAMDAIAIRLGMWNWGHGLKYQYFGVPYTNFWAWFWVAFFYSFGIRMTTLLVKKTTNHSQGHSSLKNSFLIALSALIIGLLGVLSTNFLIARVIPTGIIRTSIIIGTLCSVLILIFCFRPRFAANRNNDSVGFWVAIGFHLYFLIVGMITKLIFQPIFLLVMSLAMIALSFYLHQEYLRRVLTLKSYRSENL